MKLATFDAYVKAKQEYEKLKLTIFTGDADVNSEIKLEALGNAIEEYLLNYFYNESEALEWLRNWRTPNE